MKYHHGVVSSYKNCISSPITTVHTILLVLVIGDLQVVIAKENNQSLVVVVVVVVVVVAVVVAVATVLLLLLSLSMFVCFCLFVANRRCFTYNINSKQIS